MATNTKPRQLVQATGATDPNPVFNLTSGTDSGKAPVPLRRDSGHCHTCGRPLDDAAEVRRNWRLLRSGEHIGGTGEFRTYRCPCGERRRLLHTVWMPPYRGRAA